MDVGVCEAPFVARPGGVRPFGHPLPEVDAVGRVVVLPLDGSGVDLLGSHKGILLRATRIGNAR